MFRTVTTQIAVSQVIGHDEYHVRLRVGESEGRSACGGLFERGLVRNGIGLWLIRRHMGGEQEAGDEGGKTSRQFRSDHGSLVGFRIF